jgi:hypothetical protein
MPLVMTAPVPAKVDTTAMWHCRGYNHRDVALLWLREGPSARNDLENRAASSWWTDNFHPVPHVTKATRLAEAQAPLQPRAS